MQSAAPPEPSIHRQVLALAWPVVTHMLLTTLVFMAGRILVGRLGATELASMQISGPLLWSIQSVFTAFSAGTLAVVGRSQGGNEPRMAATVARVSIQLSLVLGASLMVPLLLLLRPLLGLLFPAATPEVIDAALAYMRPMLLAMPLTFVEAVAAASLQASGDTRTPMRVAVLINLVNIAISPVLMFGLLGVPRMGVAGAGIGGAIAFALEGALLIVALYGRQSRLPMREHLPSRRREALQRILRVALPAFAEKVAYHGGFLGYVAIIGVLGPVAMAANQALIGLESLCFLTADGFGIAASSLVARKLGAGRPGEAAHAMRSAAAMGVGVLTACALVFVTFPEPLMRLFTDDAEIVSLGARVMVVMLLAEPVMGLAIVIVMALRGAGDTRTVLGITLVCAVVVRLGMSWLLAVELGWGLMGVWLGSTADWACRALLGAFAVRWGRWRRIPV